MRLHIRAAVTVPLVLPVVLSIGCEVENITLPSATAVQATLETPPVETSGDAADDPAIWVNADDPAESLVIGTQKQSGLYLYDLSGRIVQHLADGRMNNVDVRDGLVLDGAPLTLVAATNRTTKSVSLYALDGTPPRLRVLADSAIPTDYDDPYGVCLYHRPGDASYYVFATDQTGAVDQWMLRDAGNGRVGSEHVRSLQVSSISEGCVVDDTRGILYVAEETVGIWRFDAAPEADSGGQLIVAIADNENLRADIEGLTIFAGGSERNWLIASSQGNNSFAVFDRDDGYAYLGSFAIVDDDSGIDAVSDTDGIDVTSAALGPSYPGGLFVAQDGNNTAPRDNQNFKYVSFADVIAGLQPGLQR